MHRRVLAGTLVVLLISGLNEAPVLAGQVDVENTESGGSVAVETKISAPSIPSGRGSAATGWRCVSVPGARTTGLALYSMLLERFRAENLEVLDFVLQTCTSPTGERRSRYVPTLPGGAVVPPPPPAGVVLATAAAAELVLPVPEVATSPPCGGLMLVGVPVWFWSENGQALAESASVPEVSATVFAQVEETAVELGDGTSVRCDGAGLAFRPGRTGVGACSHVFQARTRASVTVSVRWSLSWTATDGTSGVLEDVVRSTSLDLVVSDGQAVTD